MSQPLVSSRPQSIPSSGTGPVHPISSEQTVARGSSPQQFIAPSETAKRAEESWVGQSLGKYKVEKWLGGGGMGQVYLARHSWLELPVAIKVMNPLYSNDIDAVNRFRREARMAASLSHPNIVRCTDGGATKNSLYLVTEYLDGMDLKEFVAANGPFEPENAAWIISESAKALQHAHSRGMIHRDIKPSNLMLLKDGTVKLLDLGLARYVDSQTNLTSTGQFLGTVDYVSPEQALDTRNVDHRADIYSLGCTFYYLLSGQAPFAGEAYDSVVSKILAQTEEEPPPITRLAPKVTKQIQKTLHKMMAKSPDARFQTAEELVRALASVSKPMSLNRSLKKGAAKSNFWLQKTVGFFAACAGFILRTVLSTIGLIERVENPVHSRVGGKKQFEWRFSPKGLVTLTLILFLIYTVFFSGFITIHHSPL